MLLVVATDGLWDQDLASPEQVHALVAQYVSSI